MWPPYDTVSVANITKELNVNKKIIIIFGQSINVTGNESTGNLCWMSRVQIAEVKTFASEIACTVCANMFSISAHC